MASREKKKNLSGNVGDTGKRPAKGVFIALVLFLLAGVWGCSGSEPSSRYSSSPSQQGETGMTESQMNEILAKEGLLEEAYSYVTPSSILSAESDSIWYLIDQDAFEKGKDSAVRVAYVCKDGAFRRYALNEDYTLGKFAKMSDEEIISELENLQGPLNESLVEVQQNLTTELQCLQPWLQSEKVIVSRETPFSMSDRDGYLALDKHVPAKINFICDTKQFSDLLGEYAENLSALEEWFKTDNGKISGQKLAVFTDSTGNAVSSERLTLEYTSPTLLNVSETLSNYDSREAFAEFQLEHLFDKTVDYTLTTSPETLDFLSLQGFLQTVCQSFEFIIEDTDTFDENGRLLLTPEMSDSFFSDDWIKSTYDWASFTNESTSASFQFPKWRKCKFVYSGHDIDSEGWLNFNFEATPEIDRPNVETLTAGQDNILFNTAACGLPQASQIYDSFYSGYSVQVESEDTKRFAVFVTRVDDPNAIFVLDNLETDGIEIDPEESQAESVSDTN